MIPSSLLILRFPGSSVTQTPPANPNYQTCNYPKIVEFMMLAFPPTDTSADLITRDSGIEDIHQHLVKSTKAPAAVTVFDNVIVDGGVDDADVPKLKIPPPKSEAELSEMMELMMIIFP